jgi:hypothetical protein
MLLATNACRCLLAEHTSQMSNWSQVWRGGKKFRSVTGTGASAVARDSACSMGGDRAVAVAAAGAAAIGSTVDSVFFVKKSVISRCTVFAFFAFFFGVVEVMVPCSAEARFCAASNIASNDWFLRSLN